MPTLRNRFAAALRGWQDPARVLNSRQLSAYTAFRDSGQHYKSAPDRWVRIKAITDKVLADAGLAEGKLLEIGGRFNPRNQEFPGFDYTALDLKKAPGKDGVAVLAGDITNCPHLPDASFDFILSVDVFEHIATPWLAGQEIVRLLRPGGVTVHSTLFAWRYHPCPIDYWRYSPAGLASLFEGLTTLHADFDHTERRRNMLGRDGNAIEPDALGGWRENVRVTYAGQKPR